jgi:hypothetical protein
MDSANAGYVNERRGDVVSVERSCVWRNAAWIVILASLTRAQFAVTVNATDYSGMPLDSVRVDVQGQSPTAIDTTFVLETGGGVIALPGGVYRFVFTQPHCHPDSVDLVVDGPSEAAVQLKGLCNYHSGPIAVDTFAACYSPHYISGSGAHVTERLVIEPGVHVVFLQGDNPTLAVTGAGEILAHGTSQDSICFHAEGPVQLGQVVISEYDTAAQVFEYCSFRVLRRFAYVGAAESNKGARVHMSHCSFYHMYGGLEFGSDYILAGGLDTFRLVDSEIRVNFATAVKFRYLEISSNFFYGAFPPEDVPLSGVSLMEGGLIQHNNFYGPVFLTDVLGAAVITDNLFSDVQFGPPDSYQFDMHHNYYHSVQGDIPLGLGHLATVNANGDSTDFFYNLFGAAGIADTATGLLSDNSRLIRAASDGGNIGVYQGAGTAVRGVGYDFRPYRGVASAGAEYFSLRGRRVGTTAGAAPAGVVVLRFFDGRTTRVLHLRRE